MIHDDPRQLKIVQEAETFAEEEIKPFVSDYEDKGKLPKSLLKKMAEQGYIAATFPQKYGGLELNPIYYGMLTEAIGKVCCSARAALTVQTSLVGETLLRWGNEKQKDEWLPAIASGEKTACFALSEPAIGSNAKAVETTYIQEGTEYLLNGKKKWITLAGVADLFLVIASNAGKVTAFMLERDMPGIRTHPMKGLMASKAAHIAEIELVNVVVPETNIIGRKNGGFNYVCTTALDHGRYSIAWAGLAIAQAAVDAMVTYSRKRHQFDRKICNFQLIQGLIADAVTKLHAARALCLRAGKMRMEKDANAVAETTIAKYYTSQIAMEIASSAVQVHGGNGCWNQYPVERLFREAKIMEIIEGSSQIQQLLIAKYGLNTYYKRG